jgi:hypothetical protein
MSSAVCAGSCCVPLRRLAACRGGRRAALSLSNGSLTALQRLSNGPAPATGGRAREPPPSPPLQRRTRGARCSSLTALSNGSLQRLSPTALQRRWIARGARCSCSYCSPRLALRGCSPSTCCYHFNYYFNYYFNLLPSLPHEVPPRPHGARAHEATHTPRTEVSPAREKCPSRVVESRSLGLARRPPPGRGRLRGGG